MLINPVTIRVSRHHLEVAMEATAEQLAIQQGKLRAARPGSTHEQNTKLRIAMLEGAHDALTDALAREKDTA